MEKDSDMIFGREIHQFQEVSSTNDIARTLAMGGAQEGEVVLADRQVKGRGRRGKSWISPEGGIWFSIILKPEREEAHTLTFLAAVSINRVLNNLGLTARIKWPNDILIEDRKLCGILTETTSEGNRLEYAIVGVGINANIDGDSFPEDLQGSVTSLRYELGRDVEKEKILESILGELERDYNKLKSGGFQPILEEWKDNNCVLGAHVKVQGSGEEYEGLALDVDDDGALIIKLGDGSRKRVISGTLRIIT
jgi:BirA family biotin operon repressor/biotin-[acetyl-CoA-carboxylase] ligase